MNTGNPKLRCATCVFTILLGSTAALPAAEPDGRIRVACLGDSITYGARVKRDTQSYPAVMQKLLGQDYEVRNFGIGGATLLKTGRPNVWQALGKAKAFRPQVVVISLGTNDTVGGRRANWAKIAAFDGDCQTLIDELAALDTGPRILLCTPTAMVLETPGLSPARLANLKERKPRLQQLCKQIRTVARANGKKNVGLIELNRVLAGRPKLVTEKDGVHPSAAGYRAVAEALAPHVRRAWLRPGGDGYIMFDTKRTAEQIEASYGRIPPVKHAPPADRWKLLPRTLKRLRQGPTLRVVMLGDSIINDTARSSWPLLLSQKYPKCGIRLTTSVRGGTGCWHYKAPGRVQAYVLDFAPDLVIIGGISQRGDIDSIREVIRQIRAACKADIMLMTGPFGSVDPNDDKQWAKITRPPKDSYRASLRALAAEQKTAFLDIQAAWGRYIRASGKETVWFKRDAVHANDRGEQILGHILARHLAPPDGGPRQPSATGQKSRPPEKAQARRLQRGQGVPR